MAGGHLLQAAHRSGISRTGMSCSAQVPVCARRPGAWPAIGRAGMAGNFTDHVRWRMAGYAERPSAGPRRLSITARDETKFAEYFAVNARARPVGPPTMPVVVEPLRYTGQSEIAADIANFKAALGGVSVAEAFLPANS